MPNLSAPISRRNPSRHAWDQLARNGCFSSHAYGREEFAEAQSRLDFKGWIPWRDICSVLCLAAGGGQQSALFASLGYRVTVVDISPEQLKIDESVAADNGFDIDCIQGDMLDLDRLLSRQFDLVYQPISIQYTGNVRALYKKIYAIVRPGGFYWAEHWNPFQMQLAAIDRWDGQSYRIAEPQGPAPVPWIVHHSAEGNAPGIGWHYIHSFDDLIGGLCDVGFRILRFAERHQADLQAAPGSDAHLAAYIPPFIATFAQRPARGNGQSRGL